MTQENDAARTENQHPHVDKIERGMEVEDTAGDLSETDISKPKVEKVVRNQQGEVEDIVVEKGLLFRKKIEVPADLIEAVEPGTQKEKAPGEVVIKTTKQELNELEARGEVKLSAENQQDVLGEVQESIPTAEAVREMEATRRATRGIEAQQEEYPQPARRNIFTRVFHDLGPGFLSGMSGNDATAVTTYAINGATAGFGQLWLMLLSTPMYQAVLYSCAKIGRVSQKGLSELLEKHYGRWAAVLASLVLTIANVALIAGNLVAIGSGFQLITGIYWAWFVIPAAAFLWYIVVFRSFKSIEKIFIVMSLAFVTYIITAIFSHADWGSVLIRTFVPKLNFSFADVSAAVALLGATMSPYTMFWQVEGEREQKRPGGIKQELREATIDVASGVIGGNLISYFIIITTAATLFTHHHSINTAADAANALQPLVGPFAKYLFAIGLIGAGLISIPVFLASTSYAISETFGWPEGLSEKPWQAEGFYLIITAALLASLVLALVRIDPIQLIFYANVLVGVLAPILVIFITLVGNNRKVMKNERLGWLTNFFLGVTVLVLIVAAVLFFYGLASGQGGG